MKDTVLINDKRYRMAIFKSLMAVELHTATTKTQENIKKDLTKAESEGKLRIYVPERR